MSDLTGTVPVSQPAVSQHLRVLKEARLVRVHKQAQQRIYSLNPEGLAELRAYVEDCGRTSWDPSRLPRRLQPKINPVKRREAMDKMQTSMEALAPVVKSVRVGIPLEMAFHMFTENISGWWPLATHSVGGESVESCILEGKVGGRFYEVQKDGVQSDWGRVLVWEPPYRLAFTLHPGRTPDFATEVEVSFQEDSGGTIVTLIHRGWERLGEIGQAQRDNYNSGWDTVLENYAKYIESMELR